MLDALTDTENTLTPSGTRSKGFQLAGWGANCWQEKKKKKTLKTKTKKKPKQTKNSSSQQMIAC